MPTSKNAKKTPAKSKKASVKEVTKKETKPVKDESTYDEDVITVELQSLLTPLAIIIGAFMISAAIFFSFKTYGGVVADESPTNNVDAAVEVDDGSFSEVTVSIDDDAVLGNEKKAKVAIIEFSDYECPFCQRHWEETHLKLVENYVDTEDVIIVYRDLPLTSIHPLAMPAAQAAHCAQEQGDDDTYYAYHDEIFKGTLESLDSLDQFAKNLDLDMDDFSDCLDSGKYEDEVNDDLADATAVGLSGTPGFVIGLLDDNGDVTGVKVPGAYPYETFAEIIDGLLES